MSLHNILIRDDSLLLKNLRFKLSPPITYIDVRSTLTT
jgi:hypothetical protein